MSRYFYSLYVAVESENNGKYVNVIAVSTEDNDYFWKEIQYYRSIDRTITVHRIEVPVPFTLEQINE